MTDITLTAPRGAPRGQTATPVEARLVFVHPPHAEGRFSLGAAGSMEIGRGAALARTDAALALPEATLSRTHAVVAASPDPQRPGHVLADRGSRNGTYLNGARVTGAPCHLREGDVLRLGDALAVYESGRGVSLAGASQDPPGVSRLAVPGEAATAVLLRWQIDRAARDPSPCLVVGETGTGKELVAAELHRLSGRSGPLVTLNCAALSPQLVESQLFGHARGAFTGAVGAHQGVFRAAEHGTLFLDEIGELPLELQPKLLRALQEREIHPVGETRAVRVDVRVVAATHRDLPAMVEQGAFRRDLFARLGLWEVNVPPLRARRADLLSWFTRLETRWRAARSESVGAGLAPIAFDADAAEALLLAPFAENLRAVDRLVHRFAAEGGGPVNLARLRALGFATDAVLEAPPPAPPPTAERPGLPDAATLAALLTEHGGSVRAVARALGRDRKQVYRWIERFGLRAASEAEEGADEAP